MMQILEGGLREGRKIYNRKGLGISDHSCKSLVYSAYVITSTRIKIILLQFYSGFAQQTG